MLHDVIIYIYIYIYISRCFLMKDCRSWMRRVVGVVTTAAEVVAAAVAVMVFVQVPA